MDYIWQLLYISNELKSFISMDFIIDLIVSSYFDNIYVIIERVKKSLPFISYKTTISKEKMTRLFLDNIYQYHKLSDEIILDPRCCSSSQHPIYV